MLLLARSGLRVLIEQTRECSAQLLDRIVVGKRLVGILDGEELRNANACCRQQTGIMLQPFYRHVGGWRLEVIEMPRKDLRADRCHLGSNVGHHASELKLI